MEDWRERQKHFAAIILDLEQHDFNQWLDEIKEIEPLQTGPDYLVLYRADLSPQEAVDFLKE